MQRLKALQNGQFGLKQLNCQTNTQNVSRDTLELFSAKNGSKKTPYIPEMKSFGKWPKLTTTLMQRL